MHAYTLQTARSVRSYVLVKRLLANENLNKLQPQSFHFAQKMLENGEAGCVTVSLIAVRLIALKKGTFNVGIWLRTGADTRREVTKRLKE